MASRLIKEDRLPRIERLKRAGEFRNPHILLRHLFPYLTFPTFPIEESRKHLHITISTLGAQIDGDLRDRITTIHQNSQSLATQTCTLKDRTTALNKTTRQWSGIAESARSKLKVCISQNSQKEPEKDTMLIHFYPKFFTGTWRHPKLGWNDRARTFCHWGTHGDCLRRREVDAGIPRDSTSWLKENNNNNNNSCFWTFFFCLL